MIEDTCKFLKDHGKEVIYGEHFFDGYKSNATYALKTILSAKEGGADSIVLCDTNGGCLSHEIYEIIQQVKEVCDLPLGIHVQ